MKFFIPHARNDKEAESVYSGIKKFATEQTGWPITDRRIKSLRYRHEDKEFNAEVGKVDDRVGEEVIAILESNTYLICTPNRCVLRGEPILVGKEEVYQIEDFE